MMILLLWLIVIVFNLVWILRKKPYKKFRVVELRKLRRKIRVKR